MIVPDMTVRIEGPIPPQPERLLSVADVAKWLGVSEHWVRAHAGGRRAPALPVVRVNRGIMRFSSEDINKWIQEKKVAA